MPTPAPRERKAENSPNILDDLEGLQVPDNRPPRRATVRVFGDRRFVCERPGCWISECGRFGIYQMMAGMSAEQWVVHQSNTGDPIDGEMIGVGLTMAESVCEAFSLPWDSVYRKHGVGSSA